MERVIQDMESLLSVDEFKDLGELNREFSLWRYERNRRIHRTTLQSPDDEVFIACALSASADFIVGGDNSTFSLSVHTRRSRL